MVLVTLYKITWLSQILYSASNVKLMGEHGKKAIESHIAHEL